MLRTANEILCGLETLDWVDVDPMDGNPDTCPAGIFDFASAPGSGATIQTFDNDPASPTGGNLYVGRTVISQGNGEFGAALFIGSNFDLKPGEAYLANRADTQGVRTMPTYHF